MAKNILADFNYEEHADLLAAAGEDGVHLVHTQYDDGTNKGGFSFAWSRCSDFASGRMVEVAVSFCSPRDTFCRKIGATNALRNFYDSRTILLPVGSSDSAEIVHNLRRVFFSSITIH